MKITAIDNYGITEYKLWFKLVMTFTILYGYISIMAYPLFLIEHQIGNIKTYNDAFWVLQMSASTIGFGDFYPVTTTGRWIVAFSFYIGVGLAGYAGTTIAGYFTNFTDKSIQNRELRKQNEEIIELLKKQ